MNDEIRPSRIDVSQADLDDLCDRPARTRWSRGVPAAHLRELADYWRDGYDWRRREARLNGFPQFLTEIEGRDVHSLHIRSAEPDALPLVHVAADIRLFFAKVR